MNKFGRPATGTFTLNILDVEYKASTHISTWREGRREKNCYHAINRHFSILCLFTANVCRYKGKMAWAVLCFFLLRGIITALMLYVCYLAGDGSCSKLLFQIHFHDCTSLSDDVVAIFLFLAHTHTHAIAVGWLLMRVNERTRPHGSEWELTFDDFFRQCAEGPEKKFILTRTFTYISGIFRVNGWYFIALIVKINVRLWAFGQFVDQTLNLCKHFYCRIT